MVIVVPNEEEERAEADLLHVHADEDVLDCLGEEEAASVGCGGLLKLPQEQVLVEFVEREESKACEAVDDRGDNGVADGWYMKSAIEFKVDTA